MKHASRAVRPTQGSVLGRQPPVRQSDDDLAGLVAALGSDWLGAIVDLERSCVALARDDPEDAERCVHLALAVFVRLGRRRQLGLSSC